MGLGVLLFGFRLQVFGIVSTRRESRASGFVFWACSLEPHTLDRKP